VNPLHIDLDPIGAALMVWAFVWLIARIANVVR
jgi:hypothetical protein